MKMEQGANSLTTSIKAQGIHGIIRMRMTQRKFWAGQKGQEGITFIHDVFCGTGENIMTEGDVVKGSPIAICDALEFVYQQEMFPLHGFQLSFSDIREPAIDYLRSMIDTSMYPKIVRDNIRFIVSPAAARIQEIHGRLREDRNPNHRAIVIVDPNGPTKIPRDELLALGTDPLLKARVDILIHISAAAVKRIMGARDKKIRAGGEYETAPWIMDLENFGSDLVLAIAGGRDGWIRHRLPGDKWQWMIIAFFGNSQPRNDWSKQGYVRLHSPEGMELLEIYSTFGYGRSA